MQLLVLCSNGNVTCFAVSAHLAGLDVPIFEGRDRIHPYLFHKWLDRAYLNK